MTIVAGSQGAVCALINICPALIATKLTDPRFPSCARDIRPLVVVAVILLKARSHVLNLLFAGPNIVFISMRSVKGSPPIYCPFSTRKQAIFIKQQAPAVLPLLTANVAEFGLANAPITLQLTPSRYHFGPDLPHVEAAQV